MITVFDCRTLRAMKTLFPWSGLREFRCEGSVPKGITFHTGVGFSHPYSLNATELHQILTEFSGREVKIGTHRTAPPDGSIGDWIKGRFKLGGIMSYLGVVLVEEGYAERCSKLDRIRINKYPGTR